MANTFFALRNGAVGEDHGRCTCGESDMYWAYAHEPGCGMDLIGFLPGMPDTEDSFDLLPSSLWDMSGVDYSTGPRVTEVPQP